MKPNSQLALIALALMVSVTAAGWYFADDFASLFNSRPVSDPAEESLAEGPGRIHATDFMASHGRTTAAHGFGSTNSAIETSLILREVFEQAENQPASVIIQHLDSDADLFTVGQRVYDLAELAEIHPDYVLLREADSTFRLDLRPLNNTVASSANTPSGGADNPFSEITNPADFKNYSIRELSQMATANIKRPAPGENLPPIAPDVKLLYVERLRAVLANAKEESFRTNNRAAWAALDYEPDMRLDEVAGLRITGEASREFLARHGLEPGDVITSVNGVKLDSKESASEAMQMIGESSSLDLIIEHGNETRNISVTK